MCPITLPSIWTSRRSVVVVFNKKIASMPKPLSKASARLSSRKNPALLLIALKTQPFALIRENFPQFKNFISLKYLLFSLTFADKPSAKLVLKNFLSWEGEVLPIPNHFWQRNNYRLRKSQDRQLFFLAMEAKLEVIVSFGRNNQTLQNFFFNFTS